MDRIRWLMTLILLCSLIAVSSGREIEIEVSESGSSRLINEVSTMGVHDDFSSSDYAVNGSKAFCANMSLSKTLTMNLDVPETWLVEPVVAVCTYTDQLRGKYNAKMAGMRPIAKPKESRKLKDWEQP